VETAQTQFMAEVVLVQLAHPVGLRAAQVLGMAQAVVAQRVCNHLQLQQLAVLVKLVLLWWKNFTNEHTTI
jgi:hypothetical protein